MKPPIKRALSVLAAILVLVATTASGCNESNDFEGRLEALNGAYVRGQQAREAIAKLGIPIETEAACNDAWVSTGTRDEEEYTRWITNDDGKRVEDVAFKELRRISFVNGCMNRPNVAPSGSSSSPTQPSASAD